MGRSRMTDEKRHTAGCKERAGRVRPVGPEILVAEATPDGPSGAGYARHGVAQAQNSATEVCWRRICNEALKTRKRGRDTAAHHEYGNEYGCRCWDHDE